jgi:hypothetical protein
MSSVLCAPVESVPFSIQDATDILLNNHVGMVKIRLKDLMNINVSVPRNKLISFHACGCGRVTNRLKKTSQSRVLTTKIFL